MTPSFGIQGHRHDIAMSAFRFEEATALGPAIAVLEQERQTLVPPTDPSSPSPHPGRSGFLLCAGR